mmetsp:Transcript_57257/g.113711  ORF Transcript_57257/g.113711 Transcript_57257/m.113711 type:complete len:139 (-) Transcript_57257:233-649(-)
MKHADATRARACGTQARSCALSSACFQALGAPADACTVCSLPQAAMVKLLSLPGAAEVMDLADEDGCTALHYAAWGGKVGTVTALLRAGANKDATNADGRTPLGEAESKGHQKIVDLIVNGPPPEEADGDGDGEAAAE